MAKTHKTHRFSQEALDIIACHQKRTGIDNFSDALEDIIKRFGISQNTISARFKRLVKYNDPDPNIKPLESFQE